MVTPGYSINLLPLNILRANLPLRLNENCDFLDFSTPPPPPFLDTYSAILKYRFKFAWRVPFNLLDSNRNKCIHF